MADPEGVHLNKPHPLFALTSCMLLLLSSDFVFKVNFFKNSFRNTVRVSTPLDPDQNRPSVSPDPGPNCLHLGYQQMTKVAARKELKID